MTECKRKRLLVTGGAGFIGSNFIHFLLNEDRDVHVVNLDKLTYAGNPENLRSVEGNSKYTFVKGDICDQALVEQLISKHDFDGVINFAAESHVDRSILTPNVFVETNVLGTSNLLNIAKKSWKREEWKKKRFLQVSTDEVYGTLPEDDPSVKFTEETPLNPHSPYSASKAAADFIVKSYHDTFDFPVLITRCSNNYGPFQFPEKLVPLMIHNALQNKKLPVYGDGKNIRDWLFVEDHCEAIWQVLTKGAPGEIYNVGGNNEIQNITIVKMILDYLNKPYSLIQYVQDRLGHDRRYAIDASKIENELDWRPKYQFQGKIKDVIKWYIDNPQWISNVTSGDYQKYYQTQYGKSN